MTMIDLNLISEVQQYITSLEKIKKDLNQSNSHDASRTAEHTLRLAWALLAEQQQPAR